MRCRRDSYAGDGFGHCPTASIGRNENRFSLSASDIDQEVKAEAVDTIESKPVSGSAIVNLEDVI